MSASSLKQDGEPQQGLTLNLPRQLLPWILGAAIGGGGTFGVTSATQQPAQQGLSDGDLMAIRGIVDDSIEKFSKLQDEKSDVRDATLRLYVRETVAEHQRVFHQEK